jgi:hypothetical protein
MAHEIRHLVDPTKSGIPRRAVISPDTGLVCDKTRAPHLPEVDVLSEMCRVLYGTEPRSPADLVRRAFEEDRASAWTALRDDLLLGFDIAVAPDLISKWLHRGDELRVYVCSLCARNVALEDVDYSALVPRACAFSDDTLAALQSVVSAAAPSPEIVAAMVSEYPRSCRMFLKYPRMIDLPVLCPEIGLKLCNYAESLPVQDRYPSLAMASFVSRAGGKVRTDVGVKTLVAMRRSRFDVRLAAAAASLASADPDPTHRAMSGIIETLAAHIQTSTQGSLGSTQGSSGPSN